MNVGERPPGRGRDLVPPVVDPEWLHGHLGEVVLADVRWGLAEGPKHHDYVGGHLPGAVFVDLDRDLAAPPSPYGGRHPLPDPEAFAASMARLGIGDDDTVVAYDDAGGAIAARLVWMLRATGRDAAILDGGIDAWDGPLEAGASARPPASFTARPWPQDAVADADEVATAAAGGGLVIDARAPDRYRGDEEPVDPRPGHVPGAVNRPFADNLDGGRFRSPELLRRTYADAADAADVIVYCGSGVTACHDVLALERAGIQARLYPGSWSAWSADERRPAALGDDPGVS